MFLVLGTFAQHHMMWPPRPGDEKYKEGCGKEKEGHDLQSQALKTKWGNSRLRNYPKAWENKREETDSCKIQNLEPNRCYPCIQQTTVRIDTQVRI